MNWRDFVGDEFRGREFAETVADKVAGGKDFHKFVIETTHADGSTRLMEVQERAWYDCQGKYISMEGICKDITEAAHSSEELTQLKYELEHRVADRTAELHQINARLRESEARYRDVVEGQTEFIVRWRPDWEYTFVNQAYCRFFDRSPADLIGSELLPTVFAEDLALLQQAIAGLTPEAPTCTIEHRVNLPDGSVGWTQWTNRAFFTPTGEVREYQSVGRDITQLKLAADTIREKELHLQHISRLATMGELVAGIAHEVHQPLHAAKTFAEAARRNLESNRPDGVATAIDCMQEISEAILRTAEIIRRLREYTKPHASEYEWLDLNSLVMVATQILAYETRKAHVDLVFELEENLPRIQGDHVQIEQACVNLLLNAFEAMGSLPEDSRRLTIRSKTTNGCIELTFRDVGCGVSPEFQGRVFDAFFSTKAKGMGMGLSLCKNIAEAHGGSLSHDPNQGPGATFTLAIPFARQQNGKLPP
jgi:PAS domain S-box-containing protein